MKSVRRILILCIFLIVIFNIKAFASEELNTYSFETTNDNVFEFYENAVEVKKANKTQPITNTDIEEYVKLEGKKHIEEINLEKYNVSKTDFDKIMSLVFLDPEVFYINGYTSYYDSNNIMVTVKLNYLMSLEEIQTYSQKIEEVVQDYLSNIDSTMNDIDKIIYTYNYVCRTCVSTDFGVTENYSIDSIARLLVDNSGEDLAYTKSYMYLLNQVNIECSLAASKEAASIWNLVKYEGDYYHVNTWASDYKGNKYDSFTYQFFLESDASYWAVNENHIGVEFEATNTQFDSTEHHVWHWVDSGTTMHFKDGFWYYIKEYERGIYLIKYSFETDRGILVNNSLYETKPYLVGYDITANKDKIYISYKTNIYSINYDGSDFQILYTIPETSELIVGIKCDDEKIYYQTKNVETKGGSTNLGSIKTDYCVKPVEKILFAESDLKLKPNETYNLNVLYEPSNATDGKEIKKWKSLNENVVTVENGVITAKGIGNTTITAQIGNGQVATCEVSVVNDIVYTTLPITILSNKECFVMSKDTVVSNTVITDNFPVLDIGYEVIVLSEDEIQKSETEKLGSKNIVQINNGTEVLKEYTVIVPGDTDGDGQARIFDAYEILKDSIWKSATDYPEIDIMIRDYDEDGKVRIFDAYSYLRDSIL